MIVRYSICQSKTILSKRFKAAFGSYKPVYNAVHGHKLPIITNLQTDRTITAQWGLIPYDVSDPSIGEKLMNARKETLFSKQPFCDIVEKKRCLIPADGFYAWVNNHNVSTPYRIIFRNEEAFSMAGVWDQWITEDNKVLFESFSVLTTEAPNYLKDKIDRIPVVLPKEIERQWLKPVLDKEEILAILDLEEREGFSAYKISNLIDKEENNTKKVIQKKDASGPGMTMSLFE